MRDGQVTLYFRIAFPIERAVKMLRNIVGQDCMIAIGGVVVRDRAGYFVTGWNDGV